MGIIRTIEFGLVAAAGLAALGVGGDPMLLAAALGFGCLMATIGIGTSGVTKKPLWIILIILFFVAEWGLLYLHVHPFAKSLSEPPITAPAPEHPPLAKSQTIQLGPTARSREFNIDRSTINDPSKPSIIEVPETKNISKSSEKEPPNVLSLYMRDYYATDCNCAVYQGYYDLLSKDGGISTRIFFHVFDNYDSGSKYCIVYIPDEKYKFEIAAAISIDPEALIKEQEKQLGVERSIVGQVGLNESWKLKFSGLVTVYTDTEFSLDQITVLNERFKAHGGAPLFRSSGYLTEAIRNIKAGVMKPIDLYKLEGTPPVIKPVLKY